MKKIILGFFVLMSFLSNAQGHSVYKCKNITERDSISNDLKSKGYINYNCGQIGLFLDLQSDNTFCFRFDLNGYYEVSKEQLYSKIKENVKYDESKAPVKTLNDYLTDTDKFSNEKRYYGGGNIVSFVRVVGKGKLLQYVSIEVTGITLNYSCYGVNVLFENGAKIVRSKEPVDTDYSDGGWKYKAFFTPTSNEIKLFQTQKVSAVKLYIYDSDVDEDDSNTILEDAKIILTVPKVKAKK